MSKEVGAGGRFDTFLDSVVTHSKLIIWRCILIQSKGHDFENFSRDSAARPLLSSSHQVL